MTHTDIYARHTSLKAKEAVAVNDDEWGKLVDERLEIEDTILESPVTSSSDIATKLEIVTARAKLFADVDDLIELLREQVVTFGACESFAPSPKRKVVDLMVRMSGATP